MHVALMKTGRSKSFLFGVAFYFSNFACHLSFIMMLEHDKTLPPTCLLPSDKFGIIETYLSGPAMMFRGHGTVPPGSIVKVVCKTGFTMASKEARETLCLEDGTWSHTLGRCKPVACVLPDWYITSPSLIVDPDQSSIPFLGTLRRYKVGAHIHFICIKKNEFVIPNDIYCMPNGRWNNHPPKTCAPFYSQNFIKPIARSRDKALNNTKGNL